MSEAPAYAGAASFRTKRRGSWSPNSPVGTWLLTFSRSSRGGRGSHFGAGLLVSCDGLLFSWITGARGAVPIWDHAPADTPSAAATKLVARYNELRARQ